MDILSQLISRDKWFSFLEHRQLHMTEAEQEALRAFIEEGGYLAPVSAIRDGTGFPPPRKAEISKHHSTKKRTVYIYPEAENYVLKLLSHLLHRKYDRLFSPNLYSFRPGLCVRDALVSLRKTPNLRRLWTYKVDVSNYFNSVPIDRLLPLLRQTLADEPIICRFLENLLSDRRVRSGDALLEEDKGIMAGCPISTFLADLYLSHMDHHFAACGIPYARYSDDIIVFAATEEAREAHAETIRRFLADAGLSINPAKEERTAPGEAWNFLGVCYRDGIIDVSPVSVDKLKAKMRRKARALHRWQCRKGLQGVHAAKAFIRVFNRKLFENPIANELTWVRWYFPLITTVDSLKIIDAYCQSCIRYLATGVHTKAAYNFRYEDMKALGYRSLVNAYYKFQKNPDSAACE